MNHYEEKQEARREGLQDRAERKRQESDSRITTADRMGNTMNGQPILIGHHSEKRHRRDLDKIHTNMRKGYRAAAEAKDLDRRADAVGRGGISSDDPDALTKLCRKLEAMELQREQLKKVGAAWRKAKKPATEDAAAWAKLGEVLGTDVALKAWHDCRGDERFGLSRGPVPSFILTNLGGNIQRVRKRIKEMEQREKVREALKEEYDDTSAIPSVSSVVVGLWWIEEDHYENRLRIFFRDKDASAPFRTNMKSRGFRWARSVGAWQRQLTDAARRDARWALGVDECPSR